MEGNEGEWLGFHQRMASSATEKRRCARNCNTICQQKKEMQATFFPLRTLENDKGECRGERHKNIWPLPPFSCSSPLLIGEGRGRNLKGGRKWRRVATLRAVGWMADGRKRRNWFFFWVPVTGGGRVKGGGGGGGGLLPFHFSFHRKVTYGWRAPEPWVIDVRPPSSCRPRRLRGGNGERIREILTLPLGARHSCLSTNASHFENPTLAARSGLIGEGGFPIPSPLPRSLLNDRERERAVEIVPRP